MHIVMLQFYSHAPAPDMHEMAAALREWGHRVLVATPDTQGNLRWDEAGVEVASIAGPREVPAWARGFKPFLMIAQRAVQIAFVFRVRAFIDQLRPDVVQINPPAFACLFPLLRRHKSAYVLDVRQAGEVAGDGFSGRIKNWRSVMTLRINARVFYDHSCYASEASAEHILGSRWPRWSSVHRVGQNPAFLAHQWPKEPPAVKAGSIRFVYIGTISMVRQLELLLAAIRDVARSRQDFHVDFVGPDEEHGFYQNLVREWSLEQIVTFKPPVPYAQVAPVVATYDVALAYVPPLPDWRYQPTLKILEYRALGIPVIASDNAPNRPIIDDGLNGLFVQHDQKSLAGGITRFIADREFLARVTLHARQMRQGRTWADAAREYLENVYIPLTTALRLRASDRGNISDR
jgi:glycosyltransferase involved in cell wall biosynthesis